MLIIESFRNFANSTYNREGAYNRVMRVHTLDYLISVGVCLLIFPRFSTQHALIPYHTFINPRPLLLMKKISIVFQSNFNIFSAFFGLKYRFDVIFKVNFPPNMIIPYPTFIFLPGNSHPIPLYYTLRLFDRLK